MDKQAINKILREVEELRIFLYKVVAMHGISSTEALEASENLDKKLNEYERLKMWFVNIQTY